MLMNNNTNRMLNERERETRVVVLPLMLVARCGICNSGLESSQPHVDLVHNICFLHTQWQPLIKQCANLCKP